MINERDVAIIIINYQYSADTNHSPPEGVRKIGVFIIDVLLGQVNQEGGEDQSQEANVNGRYQFLRYNNGGRNELLCPI